MSRKIEIKRIKPKDRIISSLDGKVLYIDIGAVVADESVVSVGGVSEYLSPEAVKEYIYRGVESRKIFDKSPESIIHEIRRLFERIPRRRVASGFFRTGGRYAIPGTAFKGAVRSRVEYKFIPKSCGEGVYKSPSCYSVFGNVRTKSKRHMKFYRVDESIKRYPCRYDNKQFRSVCLVCDLFGAPKLASRVLFSDLIMSHGKVERLDVGRFIKDVEVALPKSEFKGSIVGYNMSMEDAGILFLGLEAYTNRRILLGRYKYRTLETPIQYRGKRFRFGIVEIKINKIVYGGRERGVNKFIEEARKEIIKYVDEGFLDIDIGVVS